MAATQTYSTSPKFLPGDQAYIKNTGNSSGTPILMLIVRGKIDGGYVVSLQYLHKHNVNIMAQRYGVPNRHTELIWGSFVGFDNEFIVPDSDLIGV